MEPPSLLRGDPRRKGDRGGVVHLTNHPHPVEDTVMDFTPDNLPTAATIPKKRVKLGPRLFMEVPDFSTIDTPTLKALRASVDTMIRDFDLSDKDWEWFTDVTQAWNIRSRK